MMGKVVTFYSWKGGVGRTLAVANTAIQLARQGRSVLVIDWDLEAPGLDRYFLKPEAQEARYLQVEPAPDTGGLLALLEAAYRESDGVLRPEAWRSVVTRIAVPLPPDPALREQKDSVGIDLIVSGSAADGYSSKLSAFSWESFFEERNGAAWLEEARSQWGQAYDYVLIDARTGLTDSGGICTILMPDTLVLVFTANDQSFEGGIEIVEAAQRARRDYGSDRGQLAFVPLLSRWCGTEETEMAEAWMERFDRTLPPLIAPWFPKEFRPRQLLERMRVPHVARFSFGEPLPVLTHSVTDPALPGMAFDTLARLLGSELRAVGRIIDPEYRAPIALSDDDLTDESELLELLKEPGYLEKELQRLAYLFGHDSDEYVSNSLGGAHLLIRLGRHADAEPILRDALRATDSSNPLSERYAAPILRELSALLLLTNRLAEAEPLLRLLVETHEHDSPRVEIAGDLARLAEVLNITGRYAEAEVLLRRALAYYEVDLGPDHPATARALRDLGLNALRQGRADEVLPLFRRALAIDEMTYGDRHLSVAEDLRLLAEAASVAGNFSEAETLFRRAVGITQELLGSEHPRAIRAVGQLANLLEKSSREPEADQLRERAGMLPPIGFWAYAQTDDQLSNGRLSRLRAMVGQELQLSYGRQPVQIFQDIASIPPGADWNTEITSAINSSSFMIAIITPSFAYSQWCCREVRLFMERQNRIGRRNLIFPINYISTHDIGEEEWADPAVARFINSILQFNFAEMRHMDYESYQVRERVASLVRGIIPAIRKGVL